jgi:tRNA threonylcarbamoyl adenosine modification protein YeaZ
MLFLIIDTSTDKSVVIISNGIDVILKIPLPHGAQSSRHLMSSIALGFKQLQLSISSLQAIAIGVGPGSYTGIRVAAAVAKGLAFPHQVPLIGLCSLSGFIIAQEGKFASLIDARTGGAYVLLQERIGNQIFQRSAPCLISTEDLPNYLEHWPPLAGPHVSYPDADHLAYLTYHQFATGQKLNDLELIYLRTPKYK